MNMKLFDKLMKRGPGQTPDEWQMFLEICEVYLKKHKIKKPIVVELGIFDGMQKKFYEQFLHAEHIGIDNSEELCKPDIKGQTHDPKTLRTLKRKLNGRPINILFIDASHRYKYVKRDFEIYAPMCSDIVALHDIALPERIKGTQKFWNELKKEATAGEGIYNGCLFVSLCRYRPKHKSNMGIGVMIKR